MNRVHRASRPALYLSISLFALVCLTIPAQAQAEAQTPQTTLEGRAVLPSDTLAEGPPSGAEASEDGESEVNGVSLPLGGQPVQGFSAVLDAGDGSYLAMPDNGFGAKDNSADFLLRVYRIAPDFKTAQGGSGEIEVLDYITLSDPDGLVPFEIVNEDSEDRLLTGGDFDLESVRRDANGDLWFGDEFGPFLLHTDPSGRLLEAPVPLPGVASPENPQPEGEANLPSSKGFEGMAISDDLTTLYPMLEGATEDDPNQSRRVINEFDLTTGSYTGNTWNYRVEEEENAIGDLTQLGGSRFLVIERDDEEGEEAEFKKIYLTDLNETDEEGFLVKEEVSDLLDVSDPNGISLPGREGDIGLGEDFSFPFQTVESVLPLGEGRMLVLNDNNYPLSTGRNPELPDDNEAIIVRSETLAGLQQTPVTSGPSPTIWIGALLLATGAVLLAAIRGRKPHANLATIQQTTNGGRKP